jgi:cyclase
MDMQELGKGIYVLRTPVRGIQGDSNFSLIVGDTGAALIDNDLRRIEDMLELIGRATDRPIRFVINTHENFDHVSANSLWARQGAVIIASMPCRENMVRIGCKEFQEKMASYQSVKDHYHIEDVSLPAITMQDSLTLYLDGRRIIVQFMGHGHTQGDAIVYLPEEEILIAGDLLFQGCHPAGRNANTAEWLTILERLMAMPISATVPGHGEVVNGKGNIEQQLRYLRTLRLKVADLVAKKIPPEGAMQHLDLGEFAHLRMSERVPEIVKKIYTELMR